MPWKPGELVTNDAKQHHLGDECPAIAELKATLSRIFKSVNLETIAWPNPASRHTSGIAMDIMLDVHNDKEREIGDAIVAALVKNWTEMKWSDLIYSDRSPPGHKVGDIYYYHIPGKDSTRNYGGVALQRNNYTEDTKHSTHIHIDWCAHTTAGINPGSNDGHDTTNPYKWVPGALSTGFGDALAKDLQGLSVAQPTPESKTTGSLWLNKDNEVAHPYAPAGGRGPGFFRSAFTEHASSELDGLPHPWAPAARTLEPLVVLAARSRQATKEDNS